MDEVKSVRSRMIWVAFLPPQGHGDIWPRLLLIAIVWVVILPHLGSVLRSMVHVTIMAIEMPGVWGVICGYAGVGRL